MTSIEKDFIEFIAQKRQISEDQIQHEFQVLKRKFRFESVRFRNLTEHVQLLHSIFFGFSKPDEIATTYAFHGYLSILRHISYSYHKNILNLIEELLYFLKLIISGESNRAWCSLKRKLYKTFVQRKKDNLVTLIQERFPNPIVVDYGCGLAYLSLQIAHVIPTARFILVDLDSIMSEFTRFRFEKYRIPFEMVHVTPENFYPPLPSHNVCIADEVIEHLPEPLKVLSNINQAIEQGGILYGDYSDHCPELFHLHTDLSFFRAELKKNFEQIGNKIYLKR